MLVRGEKDTVVMGVLLPLSRSTSNRDSDVGDGITGHDTVTQIGM